MNITCINCLIISKINQIIKLNKNNYNNNEICEKHGIINRKKKNDLKY